MYGEPFDVPRELSDQQRESWRLELEKRLNALSEEGESNFDALYQTGK